MNSVNSGDPKIKTDSDARWARLVTLASLGLLLMGAVAGTASRWVGNLLVFDGTTGNNAFQFDVDGLRGDFGSGADDYWDSNGTNVRTPGSVVVGGTGIYGYGTAAPFDFESSYDQDSTTPAINLSVVTNAVANDELVRLTTNTLPDPFAITTYGAKNLIGNGTAGSGTGYTVVYTGQVAHRVHALTLTEAALDAAATSDETIWGAVAQRRILRVIADVTQTFSGGGITDMDVVCGPTAGSNGYLITFDVDTAIGTYGETAAEIGADLLSATYADVDWGGTSPVICRFTCAGANCDAATQGSMTIYIEHLIYPVPQ